MFEALQGNAELRDLIPFVRLWYGQQSLYLWQDEAGTVRQVRQGEGVEQGDALAPALFALAVHGALAAASQQLQGDEFLLAFLDDVYIKTTRTRARAAFDTTTDALLRMAQIDTNLGKCRAYGRTPEAAPQDMLALGPDVWRSDAPAVERGVKVLGTPIGSPEFVQAHLATRLADEQVLLDRLAVLPDAQCAWLILMYCASPRANHLLRTVPPAEVMPYAQDHDRRIWETLQCILGGAGLDSSTAIAAQSLATLPRRSGGLGLQNATRTAPGAYWAAWADALPVMQQRRPREAAQLTALLEGQVPGRRGCVAAAADAAQALAGEGHQCPRWRDLLAGARPERPAPEDEPELGEWRHGWQFYACSRRNHYFREHVLLPSLGSPQRALLRSASGPQAGAWLQTLPTCSGTRMDPALFQIALRRRLRMPLPLVSRTCGQGSGHGCGARVDALGDHTTACLRTGLLARRANPIERAWTRVVFEAGTCVAHKQLLRYTNIPVASPLYQRQLDLVTY